MSVSGSNLRAGAQRWFATTHWSVVLAARESDPESARLALEELCRVYWYPLYGWLRCQGYQPADAEDLVQGLIERLLRRDFLKQVTPQKGRFRSFLLSCLRHHAADERNRATAQKRGGNQTTLSLDRTAAEQRYLQDNAPRDNSEQFFERQWALSVVEATLQRLAAEAAQTGKGELFAALQATLIGEKAKPAYADVARRFSVSEVAVRSTVYRLRRRYRELFREEIAHTVDEPAEVEDEIRHLFQVLS